LPQSAYFVEVAAAFTVKVFNIAKSFKNYQSARIFQSGRKQYQSGIYKRQI